MATTRKRTSSIKEGAKTPAKAPAKKAAKSKVDVDALRLYVRQNAEALMGRDPNITSVGVAYKEVDGETTNELAIRFTVGEKLEPQALRAQGVGAELPATIEVNGVTVPTDVVERSYKPSFTTVALPPRDERKARADVLKPGLSVGGVLTPRCTGTIGCFVRDRTTGNLVLLSNWHVLQGPKGVIGNAVSQPGLDDDNRSEQNRIGTLLRSHLGPVGDCAISSIEGRAVTNEILGLGVAVGAVGDPALKDPVVKSGRTTGVTRGIVKAFVNPRLDYGGGFSEIIGGFEIEVDPANRPSDGEISKGGDSGSAWMAVDVNGNTTDVMLGLHFAGVDGQRREFAVACFAASVMKKLELEPVGAISPQSLVALEAQALDDATLGFDRSFLDFELRAPTFTRKRLTDLAELEGSAELRYRHFSAWLSKERKYPLCVAWNIDGSTFKRLNRTSFRLDRRGDLELHQLTNDIYVSNPFDRGHIARRADLCWGSPTEARQANRDSFFHTNIVPQHEAFNQSANTRDDPEGGVWGRLENTVFDSEAPHRLRLSLMAGPVFGRNDRKFEQNGESCLLPDEFWKVVVYRDDSTGEERAYGFLLTQRHLLPQGLIPQGLDFEPWLWARVRLDDLQDRTGIRFGRDVLGREVPFVVPQGASAAAQIKVLRTPEEYFSVT